MGKKVKPVLKDTESITPKLRKTSSGPVRDKERTKARMIAAVGKVLQKKGYSALNAPNIALECGLDKKLVWTYFGGVDNLVEQYIQQRDFWKHSAKGIFEDLLKEPENIGREQISEILKSQLNTVYKNKTLQKLIHWELGEKNKTLRKIADEREEIGEKIFSLIMPDFEQANVDLRARLALIIGGIYYLSLHAKTNGSTFCGIDINMEHEKKRIEKAIQEMIIETYDKAGIKK